MSNVFLQAQQWERYFAALKSKIRDGAALLTAAFNTAGYKDVINHFKNQEGPDGNWLPREDSTQFRYFMVQNGRWAPPPGIPRSAVRPSNKLLQMTGALRQSLVPGNIKRLSPMSIMFFSTDDKSGAHDRGSKDGNLPARPFMWLSGEAQERMSDIILKHLEAA